MRADECALVALDTLFRTPYGDRDRRAALLVRRTADRERAILHAEQIGDLELVALLTVHDVLNLGDELRCLCVDRNLLIDSILPVGRDIYAVERLDAVVDRTVVHVDDLLALAAVGRNNRILEVLDRVVNGNDVRKLEERRLHDHVEASAKSEFTRNVNCIHRIELNVIGCNVAAHRRRQMCVQLLIRPERIEEERAALLEPCEKIILTDIGLLRAGDEVRLVDEVRTNDGRLTKAQVAHRDTAGLLRIVCKVRLCVHIRLVADDLDRALVRADRTVRAKPPELARCRPRLREVNIAVDRGEAAVRDIINDTERETVHRLVLLQLLIDREDLIRSRVLAAEAIAAADNDGVHPRAIVCRLDIEVKRLAERSRLLRAVEDGDLLYRLREILEEVLD